MALNFANNNSLSAITTKPSGLSGGALNLISTQTASSSSTISFTSGIDSTYDEYVFKFYNIHPQTDNAEFQFNFRDGGSAYDAKQYQRDRVYPSWQEQMDMQYHDTVNGTTTWKDAIAKVKSDNPKG